MSINHELLDIYNQKWNDLYDSLKDLDSKLYANPFLIAFNEREYEQADLKVMIFGQETKGWLSKEGLLESPELITSRYYNFFCLKKFYKGYGRSSFWRAFRFFQKELKTAYPNKNIYFSWNNINKIGKRKGTGFSLDTEKIEREYLPVIVAEVELFKPDIVIFLTGPNRDSRISHHFHDAEFLSVDEFTPVRALAKVKSTLLPEKTIRIYHPSYYSGYNKVRSLAASLLI